MQNALERTLLSIARAGVYLAPFIPLIISGSLFFPFITGKNFAFRVIVEIIFASWLLLALRAPEFRFRRSLLLWGLAAFLAFIGIADLVGANPFKSFWSNFERMEGYLTLLHLGAYFLVASSVLNAEKLWLRFFATSVGVSSFLGIYGILQLAGKLVINQGGVRLDGTFGNAAYFAGYMLFHVFLTLFLLFRHRVARPWKWFYCGALALQVATLYFTATRGAAVGLVAGVFLSALLVALFERENRRLRRAPAAAVLVLVAFVSALYAFNDRPLIRDNPTLHRYASISPSSAPARFMVWGMALEGFKENPVWGWGQEGFNYVFNKYYNPRLWGQEQWFDRTHNIFLDWLIAGGALGLLAYLSLFWFLLLLLWRASAQGGGAPYSIAEKSALSGLIAGYTVHNFFVFDNIGSYILFFSLLAYAHARYGTPFASLTLRPRLAGRTALIVASVTLLALLLAAVYGLNLRGILVARALIEGLKTHGGGVAENLSFYRKAASRSLMGSQEVAEQVVPVALLVSANAATPPALKVEFVAFAERIMKREILRAPEDARLRIFLGTFYNRLGRFSDAAPELLQAHSLSPAKQTIAFEFASTYLNLGRRQEALALLKEAYERAPEFQNARVTYAVGAIYAKELALAGELLTPIEEQAVFDERVVKAYFDIKRYDKVLAIWLARVEKQPDNAQARVSLGAAHLLIGNRAQAIAELQKAITLNPALREQAEPYIKEIRAGRNP